MWKQMRREHSFWNAPVSVYCGSGTTRYPMKSTMYSKESCKCCNCAANPIPTRALPLKGRETKAEQSNHVSLLPRPRAAQLQAQPRTHGADGAGARARHWGVDHHAHGAEAAVRRS